MTHTSPYHQQAHFIISGVFLALWFLLVPMVSWAVSITLAPPNLGVDDKYHLVFVTSTMRDAKSADITDYDKFVQKAADAANIGVTKKITWYVIASIPNLDARDHIGLDYLNKDKQVPIYNLGGDLVATGGIDLWDNSLNKPIRYTEKGGTPKFPQTHTGTLSSGKAWKTQEVGSLSGETGRGISSAHDINWIVDPVVPSPLSVGTWNYYAISQPLKVTEKGTTFVSVPEPATLTLFGIGMLGLIVLTARRRKRGL